MLDIQGIRPGQREPHAPDRFFQVSHVQFGLHARKKRARSSSWYHHPSVPSSIEFLDTPDGKLYCRVGSKGKYRSQGEIKVGGQVDVMGHFQTQGLQYIPSAQQQRRSFRSMRTNRNPPPSNRRPLCWQSTPTARPGRFGCTRTIRITPRAKFATPDGAVTLHFGDQEVPLEFSLKLVRCIARPESGPHGRRLVRQRRTPGRSGGECRSAKRKYP